MNEFIFYPHNKYRGEYKKEKKKISTPKKENNHEKTNNGF